jgi:putative transcriptional regulator
MKDIDYGYVKIKLDDIMKKQGISINKLACRAEMQRTQLKTYMHNDIQRIDLAILARLCYVLDCQVDDLIEYVRDDTSSSDNQELSY